MIRIKSKELWMPKSVLKDKVLNRGIVGAWDIHFHFTKLAAKTIVFETVRDLIVFHGELARRGITFSEKLTGDVRGCVCKLATEVTNIQTGKFKHYEVDPRYFCVVLLVEGHLNIEYIGHEAMHVGFAYDLRKGTKNQFYEPDTDISEEAVCYPAGIWLRQFARIMSNEGLRAVGGDSKRWRDSWCRESNIGYMAAILRYFDDDITKVYLEDHRKQCARVKRSRKNQA